MRYGGALVVALALLFALSLVATHRRTSRAWRSGVFHGFGPAGDEQFATWREAPIRSATDFLGADNWGQIENPHYAISHWATDVAVRPDLSVQMWPATGGSLAAAASGAYNAHFVALARNLIAGGLAAATIRLGWEFNGTWYRWSVATAADAADYAAAWRESVAAMRSVPGAAFAFDWAPTQSAGGLDPSLSYPGNGYVSDIGLDVYDWNQTGLNEPFGQRWNELVGKGFGLRWQAAFAAAHHLPIAFPEWGLAVDNGHPGRGGGDDPAFIEHMYDWFAKHPVAFENYFDSDTGTGLFSGLTTGNGRFPNAARRYRELYSR